MNRSLALLGLAVAAALVVLLWPTAPTGGSAGAAAEEEDQARALAEAGEAPRPASSSRGEDTGAERAAARQGGELVGSGEEAGKSGEPGAAVTLRVVGPRGAPLADATAGVAVVPELDNGRLGRIQPILFAIQGDAPQDFPLREATTDADGRITLPAETGAQLVVYARVPRHLIAFQLVPELAEDEQRDLGELRLEPGGYLVVQVGDAFGQAIEDATVVLVLNEPTESDELPIHHLRTDADGRAVFGHLSFREYKVEVAKHGYLHFRQDAIAITTRGDGRLDVTLETGAHLAGTVLTHDGAPAEDVRMSLRPREARHRPEGLTLAMLGEAPSVTTDAFGRFRFDGLFPEAEYRLAARPPRGLPAYDSRARPGDEIVLRLPQSVFVTGRVLRADGEPASGAQLGFLEDVGGERRRPRTQTVRTNEDARFELALQPGSYSWFVRHPSGERVQPDARPLQGETDLGDLMLIEGGDFRLKVTEPDGSATQRLNFVALTRLDAGSTREPGVLARWRRPSGNVDRGDVRFLGLSPGEYLLRLDAREHLDPAVRFQVYAGQRVEQELTLTAGATLQLTVRNADGSPARGRFRLVREGGMPQEWEHLPSADRFRTGDDGRAVRRGLLPGTWLLQTDVRSREDIAEFTLLAGEQAREVRLPADED